MKTVATADDVDVFLTASAHPADGLALKTLMEEVSGAPATMWGPSIVGFGRYRYEYDSGRKGEMARIGFSPRKAALTLYLSSGYPLRENLLAKLGKHTTGKGCLYIKRLSDVDPDVLRELVTGSLEDNRTRYPD